MEKQLILEQFAAIAGISMEDALPYETLAELSLAEVLSSLKEGVEPQAHLTVLTFLAAALCNYKYALLTVGGIPANMKVLDISISGEGESRLNSANQIKQEALLQARPLLVDRDFYFGRA